MTPKLRGIDRVVTLLVGLLLLAAGGGLVAWTYDAFPGLPRTVDTQASAQVLDAAWWPWAAAGGGVVLGLLAVVWLLAHVPTPSGRAVRTLEADATGSTRLDLSAIADATAARFEELAPVLGAGASYRQEAGEHVVVVRASVDDRTDAEVVADAVRTVDRELQGAFEGGQAHLRVLLGSPRRPLALITPSGSSTTGALVADHQAR